MCQHVLECLGAFRRDEPLPAEPKAFTETIGNVQIWIEWQEERQRLEEEDRARWRAERAAAAAKKRQKPHTADTSDGE